MRYCLFWVAVFLVFSNTKSQQEVGDSCRFPDGASGICTLIANCKPVQDQLVAGNPPTAMCGWTSYEPIICCPIDTSPSTPPVWPPSRPTPRPPQPTPRPVQPTPRPPPVLPLSTERPASRMCAQYAEAVYALIATPALAGNKQPINVSLCAIKSKKLIVGGTKADPKEFPHMAAIGFENGNDVLWKCGGTLISDSYVLTAAHCLYSIQWGKATRVRVGDLNLAINTDDARPQERRIIDSIRNPSYRKPSEYHDIALVKLDRPVQFDAYVRPACLSLSPNVRPGEKAVATGWGLVDWSDDEGSDDLLKVTLPITDLARCRSTYNNEGQRLINGINFDMQYCAGDDGKDTCQGDSGGPMVVFNSRFECMYDVIGVTSFGKLCGNSAPGVYTKVSSYLSWIEGIVWPNLL